MLFFYLSPSKPQYETLYVIFVLFSLVSCLKKTKLLLDAIYTVNNSFDKATAMAISDGKILAIGTNDEITNKFKSDNTIDAKGKFMYPGLIDAHSFLQLWT
jgi:imidazolonepropionase-like amidohydrolase